MKQLLTYQQECERDEQYLAALRAIPRPSGASDLERFALDYRRVWCVWKPHFVEIFLIGDKAI